MPDTPHVSQADVDEEQVCLRFAKWPMSSESFSQQQSENCEATRISLGHGLRDAVPLQLQSDLLERD